MTENQIKKSALRQLFIDVSNDAEKFFSEATPHIVKNESFPGFFGSFNGPEYFWEQIPEDDQKEAVTIVERVLAHCAALGDAARKSPLTGNEDLQDVKIAAKGMRAALRLRRYSYHEPSVIHDEDRVLGFRPAGQSEIYGLHPDEARNEFRSLTVKIEAVLKLVEASPSDGVVPTMSVDSAKYRAGTAFIMMWMSPENPELADVADTVRTVFQSFDIRASRADDIEHEGLISERILNEIRTSEFLFADLTGTRPNVYYEVGYAHALGKRVILYRKSGTGIHFDLSGYNCPEYINLTDLRAKLTKRLVELTNRNPKVAHGL